MEALTTELVALFPWAHGAFYRPIENSESYILSSASDAGEFDKRLSADGIDDAHHSFNLDSQGKHFGVLTLKRTLTGNEPEEEDRVLAEIIANLTASGLHRIEPDNSLGMKMKQLEILNQLGFEFSRQHNPAVQSQNIVRHIRQILGISFATLWQVDRKHCLWTKEAVDCDKHTRIKSKETENDERRTKWQIEHSHALFFSERTNQTCAIDLKTPFSYSFVTVPVIFRNELRAVLNLYAKSDKAFLLYPDHISESMQFLEGISSQVAMYIENRSLSKHSTFCREIHHRVKNNLQNIAALLRMQLRRLDRISPEQAIKDSISRIMSIALVHETLFQGEIGFVDLGLLVKSISKAVEPNQTARPWITLDTSERPVMIPSREATSVALVVNELIQNALEHGQRVENVGRISIRIRQQAKDIVVTVKDDGPGFPGNFDLERDGNPGLTIVQTLATEDLNGTFEIQSNQYGAEAELTFPLPENYRHIKTKR